VYKRQAPIILLESKNIKYSENQEHAVLSISASEEAEFTLDHAFDGVHFLIEGDNEVFFRKTPDYEVPVDADMDNEYRIQLIATDLSGNQSDAVVTINVVNVDDEVVLGLVEDLVVFPNPASQLIMVKGVIFAKATIMDLSGNKILQTENRLIDISSLKAGNYLLHIFTVNSQSIVKKLTVK